MRLYLISQSTNWGYETFDSAVVAAKSAKIAKHMDPSTGLPKVFSEPSDAWCNSPDDVIVKFLGKAVKGTKQGVICASFNAG